ncbi:hypothetical protein [Streptomyces hokutonensis]|uniref:hypothetical protein n=1 Tax=Streptomyces hokutonensis TaxID=1306990 RepID=UPI0037FF14C6
MLTEKPRLIVAFHGRFAPEVGGTSDMCLRGLLTGVPVWLVPGQSLAVGRWLRLEEFPQRRSGRVLRELDIARRTGRPGLS